MVVRQFLRPCTAGATPFRLSVPLPLTEALHELRSAHRAALRCADKYPDSARTFLEHAAAHRLGLAALLHPEELPQAHPEALERLLSGRRAAMSCARSTDPREAATHVGAARQINRGVVRLKCLERIPLSWVPVLAATLPPAQRRELAQLLELAQRGIAFGAGRAAGCLRVGGHPAVRLRL